MGNFDCCKQLLSYGADINLRDVSGCTPLMHSIMGNDIYSLEFLLEHGADYTTVNHDGMYPMLLASMCRYQSCVDMLQKFIDRDAKNSNSTGV